MMRKLIVGLSGSWLLAMDLVPAAGAPRLVADLNELPEQIGFHPRDLVAMGEWIYFTAEDSTRGRELWRSDGTTAGTELVADLRIGRQGSFPSLLTAADDRLYFFADDGIHGVRLWWTDGSRTELIGNQLAETAGFHPKQMVTAGDRAYFAEGPNSGLYDLFGYGLWCGDASEMEVTLLNPFESAPVSSRIPARPDRLTVVGETVFLTNYDNQLWRIDPDGARYITGWSGSVSSLAAGGDRLWISVSTTSAKEIWQSDGTAEGTIKVGEVERSGSAWRTDGLIAIGERVFFTARDDKGDIELWLTDESGATLLKDLRPGPLGSIPAFLSIYEDQLFFTADEGDGRRSLWRSNGTTEGTLKVKAFDQDGTVETMNSTQLGLFFLRRTTDGDTLCATNGTDEGTLPVKQVSTANTSYGELWLSNTSNRLIFRGSNQGTGVELWSSDGTSENTGAIWERTGTRSGAIGISPRGQSSWREQFVFLGDDGIHAEEPFVSDGTAAGTRMIGDIRAGSEGSYAHQFTPVGDQLFFAADDGIHNVELWVADQNEARLVKDIRTGTGSSHIREGTEIDGRLAFFATDDEESGLWFSDGTGSGTVKIKGKAGHEMAKLDGGLVFTAADYGNNNEPWWSDGVSSELIFDLRVGALGSSPSRLTRVGDSVYFQAFVDSAFRLYRTDGTESGTVEVTGWPRTGSMYPLVAEGNRLFFFEEGSDPGLKLWIADGPNAEPLATIGGEGTPGQFWYPADGLVVAGNGLLYFAADDGIHGKELWRSDGTAGGTVMISDLRPGSIGSDPRELSMAAGLVFFRRMTASRAKSCGLATGLRSEQASSPTWCPAQVGRHPQG